MRPCGDTSSLGCLSGVLLVTCVGFQYAPAACHVVEDRIYHISPRRRDPLSQIQKPCASAMDNGLDRRQLWNVDAQKSSTAEVRREF